MPVLLLRLLSVLALAFAGLFLTGKAFTWTHGSAAGNDPTSNVLLAANDSYPNWSVAGLVNVGGIPTRNTQCGSTVNPTGITPPASGDDLQTINAAIQACTAGQVVLLGAGTFQLAVSELPILINKAITLRGTGNCTQLSSIPPNPAPNSVPSVFCQTIINTYNGPLFTYAASQQCGVIGSPGSCSGSNPMILVSEAANNYRWAGKCGPAPSSDNPTTVPCGTTFAADVAQYATTINVLDTSQFVVPGWILIDESPQVVNVTDPTDGMGTLLGTSDALSTSPTPVTQRFIEFGGNGCNYSLCTMRLGQMIKYVTSVGAGPCPGTNCTLTFDSPVSTAFRQSGSHDARAYWPTNGFVGSTSPSPFLQMAGVENLALTRANSGGIYFVWCAYCWAKGVEVAGWINGAVDIQNAARIQITGNFFHDCLDCVNIGTEYPIGIDGPSTEVLVDNNIVIKGGKGMVGRGSDDAVIAYNYVDQTFYNYLGSNIGDSWLDMSLNGTHWAGGHHWLFEGNWAPNCDGDFTHGSTSYMTFFRNNCAGFRQQFTDPARQANGCTSNDVVNDIAGQAWGNVSPCNSPQSPGVLRAAGPMSLDYWYAFVGNVLGTSGHASGWVYASTSAGQITPSPGIWASGWGSTSGNGNGDPNLNGINSIQLIFRHGNWDAVNNGIVDYAAGYSHTLPSSFYLTSAPSYFTGTNCTYPWPPVTPAGASQLPAPTGASCTATSGIPAKARYDAGTPFVQP